MKAKQTRNNGVMLQLVLQEAAPLFPQMVSEGKWEKKKFKKGVHGTQETGKPLMVFV